MDGIRRDSKEIAELDDIIKWGTVAAPFIVALTFSPINLDYFGLPKLTALYLVTIFLIYFQVRRWLAAGSVKIHFHTGHILTGIILLIATLTAMLSANPLASLIGRSNRYESLLALFCYVIIFWFSSQAAQDKDYRDRFYPVFTFVFAIVSIYGLLEIFSLGVLNSPFAQEGRMSSTFGNPIFFGGFLAMSLPIFLSKALSAPQESDRLWDNRLIALALVCLGALVLFYTVSRGAWVGSFAASLYIVYLKLRQKRSISLRKSYLAILALAVILVALILVPVATRSSGVNMLTEAKSPASLENRIEIWKGSLFMIAKRPLLGYGLDQTKDWFGNYTTKKLAGHEDAFFDRAHNIFIQISIDGGVLLLLAYLWLLTYALAKGVRSARQSGDYAIIGFTGAVIAYLFQGLTGIDTIELSVFLWFIIGSVVGIASKETPYVAQFQLPATTALKWVSTSVLALLVIITLFPIAAEARYKELYNEARASMDEISLTRVYDAEKYCAVQPYYTWQLSDLCLDYARDKGDPAYAKLAIETINRGLRYNPESIELATSLDTAYLTIAKMNGNKKDLDLAGRYLERSRRKAPFCLSTNEDLIEFYMLKRDYDGVIRTAKLINSIDSSDIAAYVGESAAYQAKGENNKANVLLKRALKLDPSAKDIRDHLIALAGIM